MVLPTIFDLALVADDDVFISEVLIDSLTACLVVHLDLEVLITIKVEPVIDFVSPLCIVSIARINLVGPLSYHLFATLAALSCSLV